MKKLCNEKQLTKCCTTTENRDNRFCNLLSNADWQQLPKTVQKRFSKVVKGGESTVYAGEVTQMRKSLWGTILAQLLRLFGAPLPLSSDIGTPSIVSVTEDGATGGQIWTRLYANKSGFPQIVQSAKRFSGPTGLEEYLGFGVSMRLRARVDADCLAFESAGYALKCFGTVLPLPRFAVPLDLIVRHRDMTDGKFIFTLDLTHPWLGELIHQEGVYSEDTS